MKLVSHFMGSLQGIAAQQTDCCQFKIQLWLALCPLFRKGNNTNKHSPSWAEALPIWAPTQLTTEVYEYHLDTGTPICNSVRTSPSPTHISWSQIAAKAKPISGVIVEAIFPSILLNPWCGRIWRICTTAGQWPLSLRAMTSRGNAQSSTKQGGKWQFPAPSLPTMGIVWYLLHMLFTADMSPCANWETRSEFVVLAQCERTGVEKLVFCCTGQIGWGW